MSNLYTFEFDLKDVTFLDNDPDTTIVSLQLLHTGVNRNRCNITKEGVINSIPSFYNKPIIYRLNNHFIPNFSTDVTSHSGLSVEDIDKTDMTMNIAGQIPSNTRMDFIKKDDKEYLVCDGIIHKRYQPVFMKILKNRNGAMKLSTEIDVEDGYVDEQGILIINKFRLIGVCLLGADVQEGIENSHLQVLHFSQDKYNQSYCSFSNKSSFIIPDNVKMFAKSGLELRKENGKGGYSSSIAMASYLINNNYINIDKIKKINQYFEKHENIESINAKLLGGIYAKEWTNVILNSNENVGLLNEKEENTKMKDTKVEEKVIENAEAEVVEKVVENAETEVKVEEKVIENAEAEVIEKVVENAETVVIEKDDDNDDDDNDDDDDDDNDDKSKEIKNEGVTFSKTDKEELNSLKEELNSLKEELNFANEIVKTYAREQEKVKQFSIIEEFAHCFTEQEAKLFSDNVEACTFADTEKEVTDAVKKFAKSQKQENSNEQQFSAHAIPANRGMMFADNAIVEENLNKFLSKNKVKMSSK